MPNPQPWCLGGCGRTVTSAGLICAGCWNETISAPKPTPPVTGSSVRQIRFDVLNAAYRLAFGTETEKAKALDELSHLTRSLVELSKETT